MDDVAKYIAAVTGDPTASLVSLVVFVTVFVAVLAIGRHLTSPRVPDRSRQGIEVGATSAVRTACSPAKSMPLKGPTELAPHAPGSDVRIQFGARQVLLTVHRLLSILVIGVLLVLTVGSYWSSSPNDGSMLVPAMLAIVTLMVWLKLHNWRRRYGPAAVDPAVRSDLARIVQASLSEKIAAALSDPARLKWETASPEVYRMDAETLDHARAMTEEGRPMDEICRSVQPDYDRWESAHQQAFQAVMREALSHRA